MGNSGNPGKLAVFANQRKKEHLYWMSQLAGQWERVHFPYDYKREPGQFDNSPGERNRFPGVDFRFSSDLFKELMRLSQGVDHAIHAVAVAGLVLQLNKYTGSSDIIISSPVYRQRLEGEFINTVLILRNRLDSCMTFKKLLLQVKRTIEMAVENQNYPAEMLPEQLARTFSRDSDFPLFDVSLLLENVHEKKYLQHIHHNLSFLLRREDDFLAGMVEYNPHLYRKESVKRITSHFTNIFKQVLFNIDLPLKAVEVLSVEEQRQLLYEFNDNLAPYPKDKTLNVLFEEQVARTPGEIAVSSQIDLTNVFSPTSYFKKNPYIFAADVVLSGNTDNNGEPGSGGERSDFKLLKTHRHNTVVVNRNMLKLINFFDGSRDLESIFNDLGAKDITFIIYTLEAADLLEITHNFASKAEVFSDMSFDDFVSLVQLLYENHLIEFTVFDPERTGFDHAIKVDFLPGEFHDNSIELKELLKVKTKLSSADVLLLGDTPGIPSTGLLYLASFLRRHGVKVLCRFYDDSRDFSSLKQDIEGLLESVKPGIVAVSMKWFLYIARALDMCRIVRDFSQKNHLHIKIVVGGNTASYYWQAIVKYDCIDYVIRGDGEVPLLKIWRNEDKTRIPNCVYKRNNEVIQTPVTYLKDETNSSEIYLSHLDEVLLWDKGPLLGTFFIYTHLGCGMNCFYCGGCQQAQYEIFNREKVFIRPATEVRKDITAAMPFTSTFQFDFDIPGERLEEYCKRIWTGIDLSDHFCSISSQRLPSPRLIELAVNTFKYVYWDFDVLTLSERQRRELFEKGLVKPQPRDDEILAALDHCDLYENNEVRINLVTGLPYFLPQDIEIGNKLLSVVMSVHRSFSQLHWARLHAQPGAPITLNAEKYHMHSFASTFEEFLEYSRKNFDSQSVHQKLEYLNYPYIYYNDEEFNSKITLHYSETNKKIQVYRKKRRTDQLPDQTLTYTRLNTKADQLARVLKTRGVTPDTIVGIMMERCLDMIVGITAILKAEGAYLPIDPDYPRESKRYMLKDSNAAVLVTTRALSKEIAFERGIICPDDYSKPGKGDSPLLGDSGIFASPVRPSSLAYVIYTSGSTGKPKGVMLTHRNVVNLLQGLKERIYNRYKRKLNVALIAPYVFDASVKQVFGALLQGHCLYIVPEEIRKDGERLVEYYIKNKIDISDGTPTLIGLLSANGRGKKPDGASGTVYTIKQFLIGGEALQLKAAADFLASFKKEVPVITNVYGPTECCVDSTSYTIKRADSLSGPTGTVPIGKPMPNVQVYIVNRENQPQPVGAIGEVCISGDGVARGYLNSPELTGEKFKRDVNSHLSLVISSSKKLSPNDQCPMTNDLLYKTGDMARWLPDGNIEFIGRRDYQVKIRGFRIELAEIEHQLLSHPHVEAGVVTARDDSRGDKYLCAYVVPRKNLHSDNRCPVTRKYDDSCRLSKEEKIRYERQIILDGWGITAQEKLKSVSVFVAGAGGIGSAVIQQLALVGIGTIIVCDDDVVELSNLNRQVLHDESRIGMNKAQSAKMTINRINPHVNVIAVQEKITRDNVFNLVGTCGILFDCVDDLETKFILSECAVINQIPHILSAMIEINSYAAILHAPLTPCFHCLHDKNKLNEINQLKRANEKYQKMPFPVVSPALFVTAGFVCNEALKILLGQENPAYNKFFLFNQKGSGDLVNTRGYKQMTFSFNNHFKKVSEQQGFDWDKCWRGNFLEELAIEPDPDCPLCGDTNRIQDALSSVEPGQKEDSDFSLQKLKEFLQWLLPEYMVPNHFVRLDKIPLTPNGKIDRQALPDPDTDISADKYEAPQDEVEEKLAAVWSEVLAVGKEQIGTSHNFFELGGNSLSLISLISSIYKEFAVEVTIGQIYDSPTIKEISKYIKSNKYVSENVSLLNQSAPTKLFCFPPALGFGISFQRLADQIKEYALFSFNFIEDEDRLMQYVELITGLQPVPPYVLLGWSAAGGLTFEVARALENYGCEVSDIILVDCFWEKKDTNNPGGNEGEFLSHVKHFLEDAELGFLKEKVFKKAEKYLNYNVNLAHLDVINANVHFIYSEENKRTNRVPNWEQFTNKSFITYDGFGDHVDMFKPGILEKNAKIIRDILAGISAGEIKGG